MKKSIIILSLVCSLPLAAMASYQVASPARGVPTQKAKQALGYPAQYSGKVVASIQKGHLYNNVNRISAANDWHLQWNIKQKYPVLINTTIAGGDFKQVMNQLLSHYPVKATYLAHFKKQGRTLVVDPKKS